MSGRSESAEGRRPSGRMPIRFRAIPGQIAQLIDAIDRSDDAEVERAVIQLSQSRRYLAPLGFVVGAFAMLFQGLKLLLTNWRLSLIEVIPAMWIWLVMIDIKAHVFHGKSFHIVNGVALIPLIALIMAVTAASFFLNAVFAFAIARPGVPEIRPAFSQARQHLRPVLITGLLVGLALGISATVMARWGSWWFAISMSAVAGLMMFLYVALPSRLLGIRETRSRVDALKASAVGGILGAIICSPPYFLARVGILMLGFHWLLVPGIIVMSLGLVLTAGATGSVKAVKMSAKLIAGEIDVAA